MGIHAREEKYVLGFMGAIPLDANVVRPTPLILGDDPTPQSGNLSLPLPVNEETVPVAPVRALPVSEFQSTVITITGLQTLTRTIGIKVEPKDNSVFIKFDEAGVALAHKDAARRTSAHRSAGTSGQHGINQFSSLRDDVDVQGSTGELAVAAWTGQPWQTLLQVGALYKDGEKYADVGTSIEVRAVRRPNDKKKTSLFVYKNDIDDRPVVLAILRSDDTVELAGWISAREGKEVGQWNPPYLREDSNTYAVDREDLHPMSEFPAQAQLRASTVGA